MIDDLPLYTDRLIALAKKLPPQLSLIGADAQSIAHARLCGSTIAVEIKLNQQGQITEIAGDIDACALGKAATGIAMSHMPGLTLQEIQQARVWISEILNGGTPNLPAEWADLQLFQVARDIPMRHASVQLIFEALEQAILSTVRQ